MVEKSLENPQLLRLKFYQETKGEYEYENYLDLVTFIFGSRFSFQHKCDLWLGWGNLEYIPPDPLNLCKPGGEGWVRGTQLDISKRFHCYDLPYKLGTTSDAQTLAAPSWLGFLFISFSEDGPLIYEYNELCGWNYPVRLVLFFIQDKYNSDLIEVTCLAYITPTPQTCIAGGGEGV